MMSAYIYTTIMIKNARLLGKNVPFKDTLDNDQGSIQLEYWRTWQYFYKLNRWHTNFPPMPNVILRQTCSEREIVNPEFNFCCVERLTNLLEAITETLTRSSNNKCYKYFNTRQGCKRQYWRIQIKLVLLIRSQSLLAKFYITLKTVLRFVIFFDIFQRRLPGLARWKKKKVNFVHQRTKNIVITFYIKKKKWRYIVHVQCDQKEKILCRNSVTVAEDFICRWIFRIKKSSVSNMLDCIRQNNSNHVPVKL